MKICILSKYYPPHSTEGIARTREIYAKGLVSMGHEVHVITSGHDGYTYRRDGVFIHEIAENRPDEIKAHFAGFSAGEHGNFLLSYSYRLYQKIKNLSVHHSFDLIDSPLWDIEGYITKLKLPSIPMVVRLETTSRHIREINSGGAGPLTVGDKFERNFLTLSDACVFDSWTIYDDVKRLYHYDFQGKPWRVIHHGIEAESATVPTLIKEDAKRIESEGERDPSAPLNVLYVGRLEKRKGADFLLQKVIFNVLQETRNVIFHIVGKDCSIVDGFFNEHGVDYKGWVQEHIPDAMGKEVRFYGYLSDEDVEALYDKADIIANFSRYESFGLLYLEAMRMKKPQIVFQNLAIREILHGCEGPFRVEIDDQKAAVDTILQLETDRSELVQRGQTSYDFFIKHYTDRRMLKECEQFFEVVLQKRSQRVIHVMYALDQHDGVSNIAIDYYHLTQKMGYDSVLTGRSVHPELSHLQVPIEDCLFRDDDIVLIHYWGFCDFVPRYHEMPGKKAILFHNVTNPYFFDREHPDWHGTAGAFAQMKDLDFCQHVATFSEFSQVPIRNYFGESCQYYVLPPLIDANERRQRSYNESLASTLRSDQHKNLLFVGRVVPHKKQDELISILHQFLEQGEDGMLYLVGKQDAEFRETILAQIKELKLEDRVVLTGMVSDEDLLAYYRGCDVFLSMSEHEGFCLPLIDAMVLGLPVIAFAQDAVAETISNPSAVIGKKDPNAINLLLNKVLNDADFRSELLSRQELRIRDFSEESVNSALSNLCASLSND